MTNSTHRPTQLIIAADNWHKSTFLLSIVYQFHSKCFSCLAVKYIFGDCQVFFLFDLGFLSDESLWCRYWTEKAFAQLLRRYSEAALRLCSRRFLYYVFLHDKNIYLKIWIFFDIWCGKRFAISIGQIQPKLIYGLVTYGPNGL